MIMMTMTINNDRNYYGNDDNIEVERYIDDYNDNIEHDGNKDDDYDDDNITMIIRMMMKIT